jgi:hypothetical protein
MGDSAPQEHPVMVVVRTIQQGELEAGDVLPVVSTMSCRIDMATCSPSWNPASASDRS